MKNKYTIYIPSKGRWDSRLTVKALEKINQPFYIVVEPSEYDKYKMVIDENKIIKCPEDFSKRGQGSIPVRNFIWELSLQKNEDKHWIIDDNIQNFLRLNKNRRIPIGDGTIFRCAEDFSDRYENVAFSGFNYISFAPDRNERIPPFLLNTRIYSMTLINNHIPYRWRGKFNEDTDICLRALKDGWCTILFNAFLGDKATTMKMKGGNTDTIYNQTNNRIEFAESLRDQHPDVVEVVWKFDRWHHKVNYKPFSKNKLIRKKDIIIKNGINNYGMKLIKL